MKNFHCPRWNELPDIELYMDQVVSILDKHLSCFANKDSKIITSTMINNYVKQKIVKPPKNKKYDRVHLAYLISVCTLKQIICISELCSGIEVILNNNSIPDVYDTFCELLETALKNVFSGKPPLSHSPADSFELKIIKAVITSFASLQYTRSLLETVANKDSLEEPSAPETKQTKTKTKKSE